MFRKVSMKYKISLLAFLVIILMSASSSFAFTMTSESYFMPTAIVDSGGTLEESSSSNYELYSDLDQPIPVGPSENDN